MPRTKRMQYFRERTRKRSEPCYYWDGKKDMLKYGIPAFEALGHDYVKAVVRWEELYKDYQRRKQENITCGVWTDQNIELQNNKGTLLHMAELYFQDRRFTRLSDRTKKDYKYTIDRINNKLLYVEQKKPLGTLQVEKIDRPFVKKLYENLLEKGAIRSASLILNAFSQLLITAIDYGYYKGENPCKHLVIEKNQPRQQVWNKNEVELFCRVAKQQGYSGLALAVIIAYNTAQRLTDIEKLKWDDFDDNLTLWRLKQSKTGAYIELPIYKMTQLQTALKKEKKINEYVCNSIDGKPYFKRELVAEQCKKIIEIAGIRKELLFRDLRRTAILKLDEAGCSLSEIASISGHSRRSILSIIETYAPKSIVKAISAMDKVNGSFS